MRKKHYLALCVFLIVTMCIGSFAYAAQDTQKDNSYYEEIKLKINKDIQELSNSEESENPFEEKYSFISEKKEVILDLRDDIDAIKLSLSKPITIYEEVTIDSYDIGIESASFETRKITSYRTYNGVTTKVESVIGYYIMEGVMISDAECDAFRMTYSNISFSASGDAHVSRIYAKHHQRGPDLNNVYRIVFDGNTNSSDRTDKTFSISSSSGSANWSKTNSIYSGLVLPSYTGGYVGTFYTVYFTWPEGGGGYGYDTLERTNGFGQIPT